MSDKLVTPRIVGGLYEAFHAVPEPVEAIRHWQSFGYRVGEEGRLEAADAKKALWRRPRITVHSSSPSACGSRVGSFDALGRYGRRWTGCAADPRSWDKVDRTKDAQYGALVRPCRSRPAPRSGNVDRAALLCGFHTARKTGAVCGSVARRAGNGGVARAHTRQVFIEFVGWGLPQYGAINPDCLFQTSQFTHQCLIVQDDSKKKPRVL